MSRKKIALCLLALVLIFEVSALVWMRGEYRSVMLDGKEYEVPATIDFKGDFYERNYLSVNISIHNALWKGTKIPKKGEEIYLALDKNSKGLGQVLSAYDHAPNGDYLITRATGYSDGKVTFDFPANRMYMPKGELKKLSVVELSERVQVKEDGKKESEEKQKNEITALIHVKDGRATIFKVLAGGSPVEQTYTTVGKSLSVKYASGPKDKDQYGVKEVYTSVDKKE